MSLTDLSELRGGWRHGQPPIVHWWDAYWEVGGRGALPGVVELEEGCFRIWPPEFSWNKYRENVEHILLPEVYDTLEEAKVQCMLKYGGLE